MQTSGKFMKRLVFFCIAFMSAYTILNLYVNFHNLMELNPTLTTCVYGLFGTELAASAVKRICEMTNESPDGGDHKYMKKVVIYCVVFVVLYTGFNLWANYRAAVELNPTLTVCVYSFFGTELVSSVAIRSFEDIFTKNTGHPFDSNEGGMKEG